MQTDMHFDATYVQACGAGIPAYLTIGSYCFLCKLKQ